MTRKTTKLVGKFALLLAASLVWNACGGSDSGDTGDSNGSDEPGQAGGHAGAPSGSPAGGTGGTHQTPPETEVESSYETPVATNRFVWVANPISGRIAFVDAVTLQVKTTEVGQTPNLVAAVPNKDTDVAVVLNSGSHNATVLRASKKGEIDSITLPVAQNANAWSISKSGRWAVSWTNVNKLDNPGGVANGYQDITVLDLNNETATRLSVGYRPVKLIVSNDDAKAFAITQDGVSVIDLSSSKPRAEKIVPITDDPLESLTSKDVHLTPNGALALVRTEDKPDITVVDLKSGQLTNVTMPGAVTDLDMAPDGSSAIAVVRSAGIAAILPLPAVVTDPKAFISVEVKDATIGSVSMAKKAKRALLYTNALPQSSAVVLDYGVDPPTAKTHPLHAPVLAAFIAPNATSSIILHDKLQSSGSTQYQGAFSILNIEPSLPAKIRGTDAPPQSVSLSADGQYALITERNDAMKVYGVYFVQMATQQVDRHDLASPPIAAGTVTLANRGFVAQRHPEGRITFIDFDTGALRTLTGFELGAQIVDGSGSP